MLLPEYIRQNQHHFLNVTKMDKHGKAAVQIRLSFYGIPTARHFQPCYLLAAFSCVFFRLLPIRFEVTHNPRLSSATDCIPKQSLVSSPDSGLAPVFSVGIIYFTLAAPYGKIILCVLKVVDFDPFNFLCEHRMDGVPIISDTVRQRCGRCHFCPRCSLPARGYVLAVVNFQVQLFFFREFAVCLN